MLAKESRSCFDLDQDLKFLYCKHIRQQKEWIWFISRTLLLTAFVFIRLSFDPINLAAAELQVGHFSTQGLVGWKSESFKGHTEYRLVRMDNKTVIEASSHASASGMIKKLDFNPERYRYLRWAWKIEHTIPDGDGRTKAGDDYAARIYVVFPGRFFWQTTSINYIWANRIKKGASLSNAYTSSVKMVAVESGNEKAGRWIIEERDIFADYQRLFGSKPGRVGAIAFMTDTDNTGDTAKAWYGDISLFTNPVSTQSNPASIDLPPTTGH